MSLYSISPSSVSPYTNPSVYSPGPIPPPEKEPAAPQPEGPRQYVFWQRPPAGGAGGGWGQGVPHGYLPPTAEAMQIQEPLQPGMFEGSMTLLSAQVDPDGSLNARIAVERSDIRGERMILGLFATQRTPLE